MSVSSLELSPLGKLYVEGKRYGEKSHEAKVCSSPIENKTSFQKLDSIISSEELEKAYNEICKSLKLDVKPKLNLVPTYNSKRAGGFTFSKNEINLCVDNLVCADYKIIGVKGNKKVAIFEPKREMPLFLTKKWADEFIGSGKNHNNYGFDYLYYTPTTKIDKKRYILQTIAHELIHAQQHMLLRQTEGIGEKEIIKAWTHKIPKNEEEAKKLNETVEKLYKESYWANKPQTEKKVQLHSPQGFLAKEWLNAIRNYPTDINSPLYINNAIEKDAYKRSAQYVYMLYGPISINS